MIKTTEAIQINSGIRGSKVAVLYGKITGTNNNGDFSSLVVNGYYFTINENGNEVMEQAFSKLLNEQEIILLDQITPAPEGYNRVQSEKYKHYAAMKHLMSSEFNIDSNLIEII